MDIQFYVIENILSPPYSTTSTEEDNNILLYNFYLNLDQYFETWMNF